jgi:hypothetical protein
MLGQDPSVSAQQAGLPAGFLAEVGGSVCLSKAHSPHSWGSGRLDRPGCFKLQHVFPSSSLTLNPLSVLSFDDNDCMVGDHTARFLTPDMAGDN